MNWRSILKNQKTFQSLGVGEIDLESAVDEENCMDRLRRIRKTLEGISFPNFYNARFARHKKNLIHKDAKKKQPHLSIEDLMDGVYDKGPNAEQPKYPSFEIDTRLDPIPESVACKAVELIDEVLKNPDWENTPDTVNFEGYVLSVGTAYLSNDINTWFNSDDVLLADIQIRIQKGDAWQTPDNSDVLLAFTARSWNLVENGLNREKMRQKMLSYFK